MGHAPSPLPLGLLEIGKAPKLLLGPVHKLGSWVDPKGGNHPGSVAGTVYPSSTFPMPLRRLLLRIVWGLIEGQMGGLCPNMFAFPIEWQGGASHPCALEQPGKHS